MYSRDTQLHGLKLTQSCLECEATVMIIEKTLLLCYRLWCLTIGATEPARHVNEAILRHGWRMAKTFESDWEFTMEKVRRACGSLPAVLSFFQQMTHLFLNLSKYVSVYEHLCSALSNVGGKKENISFIDQHEMCEIWWSSIITFRIKVFMLLILTSIINFHPFMIQKQHYFKHTDQKMYNHSLLP